MSIEKKEEHVIYTHEFLLTSIILLKDIVDDLEMWSSYNDDKYNQEIENIKELIERLEEKVE